MRGHVITIALLLSVVAIVAGVTYASGSFDRQVKQIWDDEDALIRAKQVERERNPVRVQPAPAPIAPKPGQRDA